MRVAKTRSKYPKKMKSRLINSVVLEQISHDLLDRFDEILMLFEVSGLHTTDKKYVGSCPIHQGDNPNAFNMFFDGYSAKGNWYCRTRHCEKVFQNSVIGFVRGMLSRQKHNWRSKLDTAVTFPDTIKWCEAFLQNTYDEVTEEEIEKYRFISLSKQKKNTMFTPKAITRSDVQSSLSIPSKYFLNRGYSSEVLIKYDVGDCVVSNRPMYERAVVPVYNAEHMYAGCIGRSIWDKCDICNVYHNPATPCPATEHEYRLSKWKNDSFPTNNYLYNYWYAKEYIPERNTVVIVESAGNVWRLEACGIHNSVATFGAHLTNEQLKLLNKSGALKIILLLDNDEAGTLATHQIQQMCENLYTIVCPKYPRNDVSELTDEEINQYILPYIT